MLGDELKEIGRPHPLPASGNHYFTVSMSLAFFFFPIEYINDTVQLKKKKDWQEFGNGLDRTGSHLSFFFLKLIFGQL